MTEGAPRRLVVIWQDMQFYGADTNDLVSFEVILEEGNRLYLVPVQGRRGRAGVA